jgi:hypothetical protein
VVVMVAKVVSEFEFMLPTDLQPLDNSELFKQSNRAVNAGTINLATASHDKVVHRLRFFILHGFKDDLTGRSRTIVGVLQSNA